MIISLPKPKLEKDSCALIFMPNPMITSLCESS